MSRIRTRVRDSAARTPLRVIRATFVGTRAPENFRYFGRKSGSRPPPQRAKLRHFVQVSVCDPELFGSIGMGRSPAHIPHVVALQ